ncbi:MAG TPA: alpha/beta fold hydrolase, partial [Pirellulales bacterium]|nr:alpha/beta fold hydrolase [Pirellulales bacterium]
VTLVVHDWGGPIGLGAALGDLERFARVVLLNTAAFRSSRMPWRIRVCRTPVLGPLAVRGLNAFCRAALWMAVAHHDRMTPPVRAGLLAPYDSWAHRIAVQRFVDDIPLKFSHPSYQTLAAIETNLSRLQWLPVQMIWGMRDWCFSPYFLERWLDVLPGAEVHRLADVGHYVVEDAPVRVVQLIERFIAAHPVAPIEQGQTNA